MQGKKEMPMEHAAALSLLLTYKLIVLFCIHASSLARRVVRSCRSGAAAGQLLHDYKAQTQSTAPEI
jgi:hypothetical protein